MSGGKTVTLSKSNFPDTGTEILLGSLLHDLSKQSQFIPLHVYGILW